MGQLGSGFKGQSGLKGLSKATRVSSKSRVIVDELRIGRKWTLGDTAQPPLGKDATWSSILLEGSGWLGV